MSERIALFDTNVLPKPTTIDGPFWESVLRLCTLTGHATVLPDIVVHEAVNLYRSQLSESSERLASAHRQLASLTALAPLYIPSPEAQAEDWEARLRRTFVVVDTDGADASEALRREALRIRPAREGRGARDSVIWLTALRLAKGGSPVQVVSRNTHDFGNSDETLHDDLASEVDDAGVDLTYHAGLDAFLNSIAEGVKQPSVKLDSAPAILLEAALSSLPADVELAAEDLGDERVTLDQVQMLRSFVVDNVGLTLARGRLLLADGSRDYYFDAQAWLTYSAEDGSLNSVDFTNLRLSETA